MTLTERVSYIKGLSDGLGIDTGSKEGKVLNAMLELLDDLAVTVSDLDGEVLALGDEIDEIYEDIDELSECTCGCHEDGADDENESDEELFQVTCPSCGEDVFIDESILDEGSMRCPACGEDLEFDTSLIDGVPIDDELVVDDGVDD